MQGKTYGHYANFCNQTNKEHNQIQQNQAAKQNKHKNNANYKKEEQQKKDKSPCPECGQLIHNDKSSMYFKKIKSLEIYLKELLEELQKREVQSDNNDHSQFKSIQTLIEQIQIKDDKLIWKNDNTFSQRVEQGIG